MGLPFSLPSLPIDYGLVLNYAKYGFDYFCNMTSHLSKPVGNGLRMLLSPSIYLMHRILAMVQILAELGMDAVRVTLLLPCRILGKFEVLFLPIIHTTFVSSWASILIQLNILHLLQALFAFLLVALLMGVTTGVLLYYIGLSIKALLSYSDDGEAENSAAPSSKSTNRRLRAIDKSRAYLMKGEEI